MITSPGLTAAAAVAAAAVAAVVLYIIIASVVSWFSFLPLHFCRLHRIQEGFRGGSGLCLIPHHWALYWKMLFVLIMANMNCQLLRRIKEGCMECLRWLSIMVSRMSEQIHCHNEVILASCQDETTFYHALTACCQHFKAGLRKLWKTHLVR